MYYVDEYKADRKRYETMQYNRCGKSGLKLPAVFRTVAQFRFQR